VQGVQTGIEIGHGQVLVAVERDEVAGLPGPRIGLDENNRRVEEVNRPGQSSAFELRFEAFAEESTEDDLIDDASVLIEVFCADVLSNPRLEFTAPK
jgi:hypothetical protein